jgi:ankyrin repeat protein
MGKNKLLLFNLLKNGKYDDFKKILNKSNIDVNIKDDNNNYLITYAIIRNNIEIVKLLLNKGAKIDIVDQEGKTIMYIPIKYAYDEIIKLLLEHDKKLVDLKDGDGNLPLHYAILFKNIFAINELLNNDADTNAKDQYSFTSLHLAVYSKNYDICNKIINKGVNINAVTPIGESALHIACNLKLYDIAKLLLKHNIDPNIQDKNDEITALMYTIYLHNVKLFKLLLKYGASPIIQDSDGNSAIHHIIIEDSGELLHELLQDKRKGTWNFNIHNIAAKLPVHILLERHIKETDDTKYIVSQSDLNYQDNIGNTALHHICKRRVWGFLKDIIVDKKLNVFIRNYNKVRPVDYVSKAELDEFFNLVADSYNNVLKRGNVEWTTEWENMCRRDIYYDKLNKAKKGVIDKYLDKSVDKSKEICKQIIVKKLWSLYKCEVCDAGCSYPLKKGGKCIKIGDYEPVEMCTFIGLSIDILFGLIYLLRKHKNACTTVDTNFIKNDEICSHLASMGIETNTRCDFNNYEVLWLFKKKLFFSNNFTKNFNNCIQNKDIRFVICPLGVETNVAGHANYLIYDKNTKVAERFEPYGQSPANYDYNEKLLDTLLSHKFKEIDPDIKFLSPAEYLPKIAFQYFDVHEKNTSKLGEMHGNCGSWSIWYVTMRLTYPDYEPKILVDKLLKAIKRDGYFFKNIIRDFSKEITNIRDDVFKKAFITINEWINDEYTQEQYDIIIKSIKEMIR